MGNPKFQVFQSTKNNEYYYRLKAGNGEPILSGESYKSKQGCLNGIASVKKHAPDDNNYQRRDVSSSNFTFNLKASNGEIIGRSENYTTKAARENGIEAVKCDAPTAPIEDLT